MINNKYPNISPSLNLDFTNSNTIDPRITFSRASAATYYDGKTVAKAEENLLKYSQEFGNAAWSLSGVVITSNSAASPDGSTTADTLNESTTTSLHHTQQLSFSYVSGVTYTQSVYARADSATAIQMCFQSTAFGLNAFANYDLAGGVLGTVGSSASATILSVGGGWYRVTMTATAVATTTQSTGLIFLCNNSPTAERSPSYTGTSRQLFVWGAQFEQRSQVTAYTHTTDQPITNYIPVLQTALSGVPRIDHDPVTGECKGLLIEEQRTNLLTYSEQFSVGPWIREINDSLLVNSVVSPAGDTTGDTLVTNSVASAYHGVYVSVAGVTTIGIPATFSVHLKANGYNFVELQDTANAQFYARFDLVNGVVTTADASTTAKIVPTGDGWFRASVTFSKQTSGAVVVNILTRPTDTPFKVFSGDGYSGFHIWGAQLEIGSFPTSYIKTEASQVTRAADSASMTGANFSSWYRQDEGSLLVSYNTGPAAKDSRQVAISADGGVSNLIQLGLSSASVVFCEGISNGSAQFNFTQAVAIPNTVMNAAVGYTNNSAFGSYLGSSAITDTDCIPPYGVNRLDIGNRGGGSQANTSIRRITYYPKRLTDAQLQALTT